MIKADVHARIIQYTWFVIWKSWSLLLSLSFNHTHSLVRLGSIEYSQRFMDRTGILTPALGYSILIDVYLFFIL